MKSGLRTFALTLTVAAAASWAFGQSGTSGSTGTPGATGTTGRTGTPPANAATAATTSSGSANAATTASTAPAASAPATVTPSVTSAAGSTRPTTATTATTSASAPIVAPRAADVSGTASTPASDVRGTASDAGTQVRGGSGLTTAPEGTSSSAATTAAGAGTAVTSGSPGGGSMAIGTPSGTPATSPGALDSTAAAATVPDPGLVPNVGPATDSTVAYLRAAELAQRDAALARMEAQILESNRAIGRLPQTPMNLPPTSQVEYAAAMQELQAREAQLRITLQQAQQADEDRWVEARNRLAADYDAYMHALIRARGVSNAQQPSAVAE